jgi:hypothetical protein
MAGKIRRQIGTLNGDRGQQQSSLILLGEYGFGWRIAAAGLTRRFRQRDRMSYAPV